MRRMNACLLAATLAGVGSGALAQQAPPAGAQIQQIPPPPSETRASPQLRVRAPPPAPAPARGGPTTIVRSLRITGAHVFPDAALIRASGFAPGASVDLSQLRGMASRIAAFYNAHGYFVAQAYVPEQDISDGVVTIAVIEGRYDTVDLRNHARIASSVPRSILRGLDPGDAVAIAPLDRRLLLLSDLPGVRVAATLSPGGPVGASDLTVDLKPGPRLFGDIEADNAGNRYTGSWRGGGTISLAEPLGLGDVLSVRGLTSGSGLDYVRASYQLQVGDGSAGVAFTHFGYHLGKEFAALDASGTENIASVFAAYPIIRSRNDNLNAVVDVDERWFVDTLGAADVTTDRRALVATFGLNGNHRDRLMGGGWDNFYIYGSAGDLTIESAAALAADAAGPHTEGGYGKVAFLLDRLQTLAGPLSLYGEIRGQVATKNLDISEKMELGGAHAVRAYPEGEGYGDEGYIVTVEPRLMLPRPPPGVPGRFQLIGFYDTGTVRLYQSPWLVGPNRMTRSGAGGGIVWSQLNSFTASVTYAAKLGTGPAVSAPDRSGQLWIEFVKFF